MQTPLSDVYRGRRVLITGHTGFKGSWLSQWLVQLGASVRGYSLEPPTEPSLFNQLGLESQLDDARGDIRDRAKLLNEIQAFNPEFVFHLAAQSLVRQSYKQPIETYETNLMGTINLLEAIREAGRSTIVVAVTTDKCYENREWHFGYREKDSLGGADPYSSSKAMAELAVNAYRQSYLMAIGVKVASARAGNVIGGGDWACDRIVPDCVRALSHAEMIAVRNPHATRPWQHVLEPLLGYLWLAAELSTEKDPARQLALQSAFNFGPTSQSNRSVAELVNEILRNWPGDWQDQSSGGQPHEAKLLHLSVDKAASLLKWHPRLTFTETIEMTIQWYRRVVEREENARELTLKQIRQYEQTLTGANVAL